MKSGIHSSKASMNRSGITFSSFIIFLLFSCISVLPMGAYAQAISGKVEDTEGLPVAFANVVLIRQSDTTRIDGMLTTENGSFLMESAAQGEHYLEIDLLGYNKFRTDIFNLTGNSNIVLPTVVLHEGINLEAVTIAGTRPLFERKSDRLTINVQNSELAIGSSASEILGRSPGIQVNSQNNGISIYGRTGANIMINGRMINIPPDDALSYLQGINANSIETIEVLTSPPANVDAQGNAGFINIVLKKGSNEGYDGSASLAGGVGTGLTANNNFNLNFRRGNWALSSSYNLVYDERDQNVLADRSFEENGDLVTYTTQSLRYPAEPRNTLNLTFDYNAERFNFGGILNYFTKRWVMDAENLFSASRNGSMEQQVLSLNYEANDNSRILLNSYLSYAITDQNHLDLNFNYIHFDAENPTTYDYTYFDASGTRTEEEFFKNFNDSNIDIYTFALDYRSSLNDKVNLNLGVKVTENGFSNEFEINEVINGDPIQDPSLTNISTLEEYVYAGYVNTNVSLGEAITLQAGLRYEYTDSELNDIQTGPVVDRTYGYFFPNLAFNYAEEASINFGISYSERINRPSFLNLAPFFIFLDPNTFITGNPSTQPSTLKNLQLSLGKGDYNILINYYQENDPIANFLERYDPLNNRNLFLTENLDYKRSFRVDLAIPLKIGNHLKLENNIIYEYLEFKDNAANSGRIYRSNSIDLNTNLSANFSHDLSAQAIYKFIGPKYGGGFNNLNFLKSSHQLDLSIQKQLRGQWGTLGFKVTDVFNDWFWEFTADYPEFNYRSRNLWDLSHTTWQLTYVLNFGQSRKQNEERKTGAEEDLQRLNN